MAGICAAAMVFVSPVVGVDGTSAYNDVAVAAIAFTLFHVLDLWDGSRNPRLLVAAGLLSGFAFAAKCGLEGEGAFRGAPVLSFLCYIKG